MRNLQHVIAITGSAIGALERLDTIEPDELRKLAGDLQLASEALAATSQYVLSIERLARQT
jgi:hypothetical protein